MKNRPHRISCAQHRNYVESRGVFQRGASGSCEKDSNQTYVRVNPEGVYPKERAPQSRDG